ncbi:MAG: hypothetical protein KDK70_39580, partial [Myxococcales bacterium]|nr:hypothetical protein [Myxococcales bacterium]
MPQLRPIPSGYDATPAGPSAIAGGLSGFFETKAQLETLRAQRSRDELETSMLQEQRSALAARKKLAKERWDQQYGEAADRQTPLIGASTIQALRPGVDYQVTMRPSTYEMGRDATPEEQLALFADETDYLERSRRSAEMAYTVGYLEDMTAQGLVREDDSSRFLEDLGSEDADPALVHAKVKAEVAKAKRKLAQRGEAMALHGKLVEMGAPTDPESRKGYFQALTDLESSDWEVSPQEAYLMGVMNTNGDIKEAIMARDEALREAQAQLDRERSVG